MTDHRTITRNIFMALYLNIIILCYEKREGAVHEFPLPVKGLTHACMLTIVGQSLSAA